MARPVEEGEGGKAGMMTGKFDKSSRFA